MTKDIEKKVIEQYLNNIESAVICDNFKIGRSTLGRVIKRNNIPKRKVVRPKIKPKYDYIIGRIFNNLKVLEIVKKSLYKDNTYHAICECLNCGNKNYKVKPYDIVNNIIKSCGCLRNDNQPSGDKSVNFKGYKEISGQKWSSYRIGASYRNLSFNIDIRYAWDIFISQGEKCNLSGQKIYFGKSNSKVSTASMDRIDSSIGYIEGNIQWVHKDINKMKLDIDDNLFLFLCSAIGKDKNAIIYLNNYYELLKDEKWKEIQSKRKNNKHSSYQQRGNKNAMFKGYKQISGYYWSTIKHNANNRKKVFNVDMPYVWDLFQDSDHKCFLSGIDIYFGRMSKERHTASLDRIDSSKGYIKGNVQWVHKDINKMKQNFDQDYFISLCKDIREYNYGKNIINKR